MKIHERHYLRSALVLFVAAALQLTTGCASFQGHQLPKVDPFPSRQVENKPTVCVDPKFFTQMKSDQTHPQENLAVRQQFVSFVGNAFAESKMFSRFTTNGFEAKDMDLTIRLDFTNYGSAGSAIIAGLISGLTVGFIPTWVKDHYRLEASVCDAQGNSLREYKYEDHMTTWFHIVLIPFSGSVKRVSERVIMNMLRYLIQEISKEPILAPYFQKRRVDDKKDVAAVPEKAPVAQTNAISRGEKMEVRVIVPQAVIRLHPDPKSPVITPVPMGAKLEVKEKTGNWYQVNFLKEGMIIEGYILQDSVEVIKDIEEGALEIRGSRIAIFPR